MVFETLLLLGAGRLLLKKPFIMAFAWTMVMLTTSMALILTYWLFWRWRHRRLIDLAEKVPGPPEIPILGNALLFMANPKDQLKIISGLLQTYGNYVRFWLGTDLNIAVKNPKDIRMLLTSNKLSEKGPVYEFLKPLIGGGILTGGPTWRSHRKIITPAYSKKAVQRFSCVFNEESRQLADVLARKDLNTTFNVYCDVLDCTTQCVCQTLMGLSKEDSLNVKDLNDVIVQTPRIYSFIFKKMTRWWRQILPIFWLIGGSKKQAYYVNLIEEMTSDIIAKRRKAIQLSDNVNEDSMGVVDRYIRSGELSEREIMCETMSVFTTSQEASAKIASAVLLFLAHLPEWQEKVYKEIVKNVARDCDVTEDHLNKLVYLDMVYKEAIRYLSIAALIQRTVKEEIAINEGKIILPAGASVVIPIHDLHRDPEYWENPTKVMPERFLPENVKKRDPNSFIPFSLGPMDCIGRIYATSLIKTLVVLVLKRVQLIPSGPPLEELELHVAISVRFLKGYNLRIKPRETII